MVLPTAESLRKAALGLARRSPLGPLLGSDADATRDTTPIATPIATPGREQSVNYTDFARSQQVQRAPDQFEHLTARRGSEALPVEHTLHYSWDYASARADLRALYEKSKDQNWNARTDLPWDARVEPQGQNLPDHFNPLFGSEVWRKLDPKTEIPRLRQHMAAYVLSNFLHGEQGALLATSQLVAVVPDADAKQYAAAQVFDEARHVEAYERYLREKIELTYPVTTPLKTLLDQILEDARWDFKYLGMQIIVEGIALGAFGLIHKTTEEPLIKKITEMVMRDESRHVAFGVLALRDTFQNLPQAERRDREDFIVESARLMRERFLAQEVWRELGLPEARCNELAKESPMMQMFQGLMFSKIVPNVKKLGLLTPRVRKGFEELHILEYEDWEPSA
jgi:hypothetical protein